ncbi:MAG: HD domain-containing protein, partial [Oscillospiraceae bacterium]
YHPEMGLIDLFGGMQDLKQRRIRCVGDPDCRFSEDSLRVMRGIRFCSQLSFSMESKTEKSLRKNASLLSHVAAERLSAELLKLLCGENVCAVLLQYSDILGEIIPEILPMVHFNQHTPYHIYDVYEHTARSVAAVLATPICRLTMLLHDIGKPHCLTKDENGRGHFKGHGKISVSMAETILNRLRLDKHTIESVLLLIRYHDAVIEPSMPIVKRWLNRLTPEMFFMLLEVKFADNKAQNPTHDRQESYREIRIIAELVLSQQECFSLKMLAINGDDLIAQGIMPGKALGETLHFLLQAVMDNRCANEKDALLAFLEETSHPS